MTVLRYGTDSSVALQFAAGVPWEQCGMPAGQPLADPLGAVIAALEQPLDYPPLVQTTTPGDRVVVVLDAALPQVAQVTAAVVQTLMDAGIDPDGITILQSETDFVASTENPLRLLPQAVVSRIRLLTHDAAKRRNLAYLAASETGEPILLNRLLIDADVVLPVGCVRPEHSTGYFGIHSAIYPEYSDRQTQARFRKHDRFTGNGHHRELVHEANHVGWLLGVNFTLQIVPAAAMASCTCSPVKATPSSDNLASFIELPGAVSWRVERPWSWRRSKAPRGSRPGKTWAACWKARRGWWRRMGPSPFVATWRPRRARLCSNSSAPPPAKRPCGRSVATISAMPCPRCNSPAHWKRADVYLLSRLDAGLIEDLEMVRLEGPEELVRLTPRSGSCLVLANAVHAMVRVESDEERYNGEPHS